MTTRAVPSPTAAKLGRVATIGYHQPQAWQIVTRMICEQGWHLVDIRSSRRSYLEEWSGSSLRRHFRQSYHAVPELGDVNQLGPANPVQLRDPATGLATVTTWLEAGMDCLLLCTCPAWRHCHRRLVVSLLQLVYPALEVTHPVPDAFAVDLPPWCCETVALLQRYGLLRPLPHTPEEQPVLLRTNKSQGVLLPGYGQCRLHLSLCLWLPPHAPAESSTKPPVGDEHELYPAAIAASTDKERMIMSDHHQQRHPGRGQPSESSRPFVTSFVFHVRTPVSRKAGHMQQTLWGKKAPRPRRKRTSAQPPSAPDYSITGTNDCELIGHTLNAYDLAGHSICIECGVRVFCPGCVQSHPQDEHAVPVPCQRHEESTVSA